MSDGDGGASGSRAWAAPESLDWQRVLEIEELKEGRVGSVTCEHTTVCMTHFEGEVAALDNRCPHQGGPLGKISKEQRGGSWDVWQTDLVNPDFAAYAKLCGALGIRVSTNDELDDALARAFAHPGPSLVEIVADPLLV